MVDYPTWVSIVRAEAKAQGADLSQFETNSSVVSVAASVWTDRKAEIKNTGRSEAKRIASSEVSVR